MKINLTEFSPSIWSLGPVDNLIVYLTFQSRGPVEVDFEKLDKLDQKKILDGMR
jgi:hypothetical protein